MKYVFGVDVGGTSVKTALVSDDGRLLSKQSMPTRPELGFEAMVKRLRVVFDEVCQTAGVDPTRVEAIGVGAPAFLDRSQAVIIEAVNLGWHDIPLKDQLTAAFQLPAVIENDANVAALGESWVGAGENAQNVLCVTVGTGIGGGLVFDGCLLRGANGMAGEVGHLVVQDHGYLCNCGHHGCLETVASATAIIRRAKELQQQGRISTNKEIHGAEDVFQLAAEGDTGASEVIAEAARWLGYGLALSASVTNPDTIVIGGGVSYAGEVFLEPVRQAFEDFALRRVAEAATIVLAQLGNDAGVIGAARLAFQHLPSESSL